MAIFGSCQPVSSLAAEVVDLDPDIAEHVTMISIDRRLELGGLADGGIAAASDVAEDEITLRCAWLAFLQGGMPARNAGAQGLDAEIFDR